jgi:hypothetical protein
MIVQPLRLYEFVQNQRVTSRPAYGQSWPFERMPDLVILPVHDLTAG